MNTLVVTVRNSLYSYHDAGDKAHFEDSWHNVEY